MQCVFRLWVAVCLGAAALGAGPVQAEKRVALVIGNASYDHIAGLPNVPNDATSMAALFKAAQFDSVEVKNNLGNTELRRALREFAGKAHDADVAVLFFAGHGIEVDGVNYLIPKDALLASNLDVEDEAVSLDRVLQVMEPAKRLRLVLLDACRENPFLRTMKRTGATRSVGRGLGRIEPTTANTFVAFAAKAGALAEDGKGPNSPFTGALLKHLVTPGLDVRIAIGHVRDDVLRSTGNKQEPHLYGSGGGAISLVAAQQAPPASAPPPPQQTLGSDAERAWAAARDTTSIAVLEAFRRQYGASNAFYDRLAEARIHELKKRVETAAAAPVPGPPDDDKLVVASTYIREAQERLYELNYDPGPTDGALTHRTEQAIREFEAQLGVKATGRLTEGLLRRLRSAGGLQPWGAIVFSDATQKWGMAWSHETRKAAVAAAQASCGADPTSCSKALTFFGTGCGAFAHAASRWSLAARDSSAKARLAALEECQRQGARCSIVATVCAGGQDRAAQ